MVSRSRFSATEITRYYILALLIVGSLAIGSHLIQQSATENQQGLGAVINLSGRQRMLSQRIASLAAQYRLGDSSARPALFSAASQLEVAHQTLSSAYKSPSSKPSAQALHQLYFGGPDPLDTRVRNFVATARQVAALPAADPAMAPLLSTIFAQSRAPLLDSLNQVVLIHQQDSEIRIVELRRLQWTILSIMLATLLLEAFLIFRPMVRRIVAYNAEILHLATTDSLTGVLNRREFFARSSIECDRIFRYGGSLSIVVLDIDHFKRVNDTYGHAAGDAVLKSVCATMQNSLRAGDILARVGGEEFAILTPATFLGEARTLADRIRIQIAETAIAYDSHIIELTASFGVADVAPGQRDIDHALDIADQNLYLAKRSGRNCVIG